MSMTGNNPKSEVLRGPERRRRWDGGREDRDRGGDARAWRHGQPGGAPARHCAEPVVQLAASGGAGRADGGGGGGGGRAGFRVSRSAEFRCASCSGCWARRRWRRRSSRRRSELAGGQKKHLLRVAVCAEGRYPMKAVCDALGVARSNMAVQPPGLLAKPLTGRRVPPSLTMISWARSRRSSATCRPMAIAGSGRC